MKTICIDIDGTICKYQGWKGKDNYGDIIPGADMAIRHLHGDGWYIIIYSTRSNKESIKRFLESHDIYFDSINSNPNQPENAIGGKPIADVYLDDRAVTFRGDWGVAYTDIVNFVPWEKKRKRCLRHN